MSVLCQLNLTTGEWTTHADPESSYPAVSVGFTSQKSRVSFHDLQFGWSASVDGLSVGSVSYPPDGVSIRSSDQQYLSADQLALVPLDEVSLNVWAEDHGVRYEHSFTFVVPIPVAPYPSWAWVDGGWKAPVPYPDDGGDYVWDEDVQGWVMFDPDA